MSIARLSTAGILQASVFFITLGASQPAPIVADPDHDLTPRVDPAAPGTTTAWQGVSHSQGLRVELDDRGLRMTPVGAPAASWDWGLSLLRFGRRGDLHPVAAAPLAVRGPRGERAHAGIVEWYVNDARGLEHGFTIVASPPGDGELFIELALTGSLSPTFSTDGQAVDFRAPQGLFALRYAKLAVVDAAGRNLAARMEGMAEAGVSGIRIRIDDAGAAYPVTVDPMVSTAAWTAESNLVNTYFGSSLQTAGDVNGDGYSDVVVAAASYSNGQAGEGKVFVYLGSASGPALTPSWSAEGEQIGAIMGSSVGTAGDVNGDGYDDLIVGAAGRDNGQTDEGQVFVYLGSPTGLSIAPAWTADGNVASLSFGDAVATAGDVNGDGYDDVLVGSVCANNGQECEGRVWLYLGSASGLAASPAWSAEGNQAFAYFGSALGSAGDVNADGFGDVIVGAWGYNNGQAEEGAVFIYHGSASGLAASPARILDNNQSYSGFGQSVGTAGDVNGDGYADVIIGAPGYTNGQAGEGAAYIYRGSSSGVEPTAFWTKEGDQAPTPGFNQGTSFGGSVATAGDVNGDGYADVIVGARYYDNPTQDEGKAFVYLGGPFSMAFSPVIAPEGDQLNSSYGGCVATAGDVNGDGYSDVLVSASSFDAGETNEGRVFLYLGAAVWPSGYSWSTEGGVAEAFMGTSVASAGDVNGDGYSDVIVGAPIFMDTMWAQGKANLFAGSPSGLGPSPAWSAVGSTGSERLGQTVAGAGDVNGDGFSDVIVSSMSYTGAMNSQGKVSAYLGSFSGLGTSAAWTVYGQYELGYLGLSIASAGDVNGDGYSDVIVAQTQGIGAMALADLYLGSASGLGTTPAWSAAGLNPLGYTPVVASAGDVNGDGYSDVIVTSPGDSTAATGAGKATVYLGSATGLSPTPSWSGYGAGFRAGYGASAGTAGDINGDGYSDVVVSAPYYPGTTPTVSRVYLYLGSAAGLRTNYDRELQIDVSLDHNFGLTAAAAGDVDGDGFADVVLGSPSGSDNVPHEGRVLLLTGSSVGLANVWVSAPLDTANSEFGRCVASAGDVNGDGFADIVVGAPAYANPDYNEGGVFAYYGNGGAGFNRNLRQKRVGQGPIALFGRSNSESGFELAAFGHSPAGRGKIRLHWEAKPLGSPFTGNGVGTGITAMGDTGSPGGAGSVIAYEQTVTGLPEGSMVHWRSRVSSRNPFFPRSPWFSPPGNGMTETKLRTDGCIDRDGDGFGALGDPSCTSAIVDCDDRISAVWTTPGETRGLLFVSRTTLVWTPPSSPGGSGTSLTYDTLRGNTPASFDTCVADAVVSDIVTTDATDPAPGQGFYYVTRARNACPNGLGSLGTTSSGQERIGAICP